MLSLHPANPVDERIDAISFGPGAHAQESLDFFQKRAWFHPRKRGSKRIRPPTFTIHWNERFVGMVALTKRKLPFGPDGGIVPMLSVEVMGIDVRFQGAPGPGEGTLAVAVMDLLKQHAKAGKLAGVSLRVREGNSRGRAFYRKCDFREAAPPIVDGERVTLCLAWWLRVEGQEAVSSHDDQSSPSI